MGRAMADQVIIIALDYSEQAETAVKWYVERMHRPGNKIVFVHSIELPEMSLNQAKGQSSRGNFHMSPGVLASMWKDEEVKTKQLEEKMKTLLVEKGIPGVLRTATGKPGEVICRISEEESATCIITGTRGMGKVREQRHLRHPRPQGGRRARPAEGQPGEQGTLKCNSYHTRTRAHVLFNVRGRLNWGVALYYICRS